MAAKKILIADDEPRLRKLVSDYLSREGYLVDEAENGEEALDAFYRDSNIDMMILDVMMPKADGLQVCREIRETSTLPIVMLTAKSEESDVLSGYECGADEYISKPFSPKILVARVNALFRRSGSYKENTSHVLSQGGIVVDLTAHQVTVDGQDVLLSVKEFELLTYFMENIDIALSRDMILNSVWDYDYFGDARTIDTHVKKLRAKLGEKGNYIKTIWGYGYKFEVSTS
jgi:DNA-binding response OmpR family regulator